MLKKSITTSERINKLSDKFALLYTWFIPFQDDFGLVWASVDKIKWMIVPARKSLNIKEIEKFIDIIIDLKLVKIVVIEDKSWIWFPDFLDKQTLKKDRKPITYLDNKYDWSFVDEIAKFVVKKDKWKQMEIDGFQMETSGKVIESNLIQSNSIMIDFDRFWKEYPRKVAKSVALGAFNKLNINSGLLKIILEDIKKKGKSEQWLKNDGQYIPHPSTYLNQKRWEDEENKKDDWQYK